MANFSTASFPLLDFLIEINFIFNVKVPPPTPDNILKSLYYNWVISSKKHTICTKQPSCQTNMGSDPFISSRAMPQAQQNNFFHARAKARIGIKGFH
jgi:uncharacterized protein YchJ